MINAKDNYQSLEDSDARALVYQNTYCETNDQKIEYLFLLENLFKKAELTNVYSKF